jgi:hypothetical protein
MSAVAVQRTPSLPSMGRESRFLARRVGWRARRSTSCRSRLTSSTPARFSDALPLRYLSALRAGPPHKGEV